METSSIMIRHTSYSVVYRSYRVNFPQILPKVIYPEIKFMGIDNYYGKRLEFS